VFHHGLSKLPQGIDRMLIVADYVARQIMEQVGQVVHFFASIQFLGIRGIRGVATTTNAK
jgi:hypothetical protein